MDHLDNDEILRRAQSQKGEDELEAQVEERASRNAIAIQSGVFLLLIILNWIARREFLDWDIVALMFTISASMQLYRWYRLRNRSQLWNGILSLISVLAALTAHIRQLFF